MDRQGLQCCIKHNDGSQDRGESCELQNYRIEPNGHTGMHSHERVHHVLALEGLPELETDTERIKLDTLVAVKIVANVPHRFINNGDTVALIQVQNLFP